MCPLVCLCPRECGVVEGNQWSVPCWHWLKCSVQRFGAGAWFQGTLLGTEAGQGWWLWWWELQVCW